MIAQIEHRHQRFRVDLSQPLDISIPLRAGQENPRAWYVEPISIEPVQGEGFIGDVNQGGSVNFRNISFNPHGHGTHTECVGHISREAYSINQTLNSFFFTAQVISLQPEQQGEDLVITETQVRDELNNFQPEALVIRTLPNEPEKMTRQYSNTNPPYMEAGACSFIRNQEIQHLLLDLPSVDREYDEGRLAAHRAFWNYPEATRTEATITEMIYVPDSISDGNYLLNLQIASFENDATPSKPVLFKILE